MTIIDPVPRPHLPAPVQVPEGHYLTIVLDPRDAALVQSVLRERGQWLEPIAGTQDDLDPVYGIVGPDGAR